MGKRIISFVLALALLLGIVPITTFAAGAVVDSGTCGENVTWVLYDDGLLEISGSGAMADYDSFSDVPWYSYRDQIENVAIGNGITRIGSFAFSYCDSLSQVTMPDSITFIGFHAFIRCINLTNVTIPDSVTYINDKAFYDCDSLSSVNIPASVTEISFGAFGSCDNLTGIWVDEDNSDYSSDNFGVLFNKAKIKLLQSPGAITGDYIIPNSVCYIEHSAFSNCKNLTSVILPDGLRWIAGETFSECYNLTSVAIPASVYSIAPDAFVLCTSLTGIWVDENNTCYSNDAKGVLFDIEKKTLIRAPGAISGDYIIPDSVLSIGDYAFSSCKDLTSVNIPDSVSSIGERAFDHCESLTSVSIPDSVTTIGDLAFHACYSVNTIIFNGDAPSFGLVVFYNVCATAYYPANNDTWTSDVMKDYGGGVTWISYDADADDKDEMKSVRYFRKWDAENQIAYWDQIDYVGSQVTVETDVSFLENVDDLVGQYVLVETTPRNDDLVACDTIISIKPVETKTGTVSVADSTIILIDGITYDTPKNITLPQVYANQKVLYHLSGEKLVGIEILETQTGMLQFWNAEKSTLSIDPNDLTEEVRIYTLSNLADHESRDFLGVTGYTNVSVQYQKDSNDLIYRILKYIPINGTDILSIKYWDDLEKQEKTAPINWGYPLFQEDARNLDNSYPTSFAELVKISALLSNASYDLSDRGYLQQTLNLLGAENIEIALGENWDTSYPAHSISHVKFYQDDGQHDLIIVTIRGSSTAGDWITDITAWADEDWESPKEHPGFSLAKDRIKSEIETYLSRNGITASKSKVLITGHSYGAAVANLLANSLEDVFDQRNIYAYTFAAPNTIVVDSNLVLGSNIYNFRNAWDLVVRIPVALLPTEKYTVFGQQYFFTLDEIGDTSEGIDIFGNHNCTHYVNYAFNLVEYNAVDFLQTRCVQIHCPVDVTAYDENGNIVGKITDNQMDESTTTIMMYPVSDQKNIFIDQNEDVQLYIVATDSGTMDVIITEYDVVTGNVSAIKEYSTIALKEDKAFRSSIFDETVTKDVELEVVDNEGYRQAIVNEDGTETVDISEKHKHTTVIQNKKDATCAEAGYSGDEVCSKCGSVLKQGEEIPIANHDYKLVVVEPTCSEGGYTIYSCVNCNHSYLGDEAKASGHSWDSGKVTKKPTFGVEGVRTYTCDNCGDTKTESIPALTQETCKHSSTKLVDKKAASCTATGYTGDKVCTVCGKIVESGKKIDKKTHTEVIDEASAATCTKAGKTEGKHCSVCQTVLVMQETISATGHKWSDWKVTKPATGSEMGEEKRSCNVCDQEETRSIDKLINPFVDVQAGKFYETPVLWAVENGITNGIDDTHFAPDNICNRGQVVTFLWRAAGSPEPTSSNNPFTDVKEGKFYYKAVLWAVEKGITSGTSATTFSPDASCTRGQVATFLWRTLGKPAASSSTNPFTDVQQGKFYYNAVLWAVEDGVTTGMGGGKFAPGDTCTRGQIVTFLYRALG